MSNIFYTADGKKFNLENFADIAPNSQSQSQSNVKTLDDSLRLKGNLSLDGTIRASRYLMEDGSDMKLSSSQSGLPSNVSFDAQGNMIMNGNMNTIGTIKASKYLMADGSEMKTNSSVQSGLPSNVSFDAQGNMNMNGDMNVKGNIGLSNTKMHFRGTGDPNHYVGYSTDVDGPVLSGCAGGKLRSHCANKDVLSWNKDGVSIDGTIKASKYLMTDGSEMKSGGSGGSQNNTFTKVGNEFTKSVLNIDAPVKIESLFSLNFGDGKNVLERNTGMGYITGQPNNIARNTLATHIDEQDSWQLYSNGWNPLLSVKGGTGDMNVKGNIGLSNTKMHFRGTGDPNHYVGYSADVDGPVLSGCTGGKLRSHCANKDVLSWNKDGVSIDGTISTNGIILGKTSEIHTSEKNGANVTTENWSGPSINTVQQNNIPQALFIGSNAKMVKIFGTTWVDNLRIGQYGYLSTDQNGDLVFTNTKSGQSKKL